MATVSTTALKRVSKSSQDAKDLAVEPATAGGARRAARTPARGARGTKGGAGLTSRIELAIESLGGGTALALLLGVNKSQPSQWRNGKETPSSDMQRRIIDLDHVVARAQMVWEPDIALDWLRSPNSHLDGATPLDVLELRGPAEVLDALDAVLSGAYA